VIKLKDILNETTKKSRIKEDNFLNRFFGNKSSGISKFGNWDYVTIDESPNRDSVYISDMVATSNFISRLNSTPSLKELLKKSGKIKSIYATTEGFPGDHVTEYTIKFPQKSISSMFRTNGSSSKEINAEEQNKEFDSLLIMLNSELVKEWNSKLWVDKFDDIKKYSQKFEPEYPDI